ncbi:hypothetical protein MMC12_004118 [Toensbergia leucococca]|nr:hypothetical protein [Toensbergia leucococca]
MLSPNNPVGTRILHTSASRTLGQAPVPHSIILNSSSTTRRFQARSSLPSTSRNFWWGKRSGHWTYCLNANLYKHLEATLRAAKHKSAENLNRRTLWDRDISENRNRPKSERVSVDHAPKDKNKPEEETVFEWYKIYEKLQEEKADTFHGLKKHDWYGAYQTKQKEMATHFADFKRRVDDDPFGMLFGRRLTLRQLHDWGSYNRSKVECSRKQGTYPPDNTQQKHDVDESGQNIRFSSKSQTTKSASGSSSSAIEDFEFDPITMRKVPKKNVHQSQIQANPVQDLDAAANIPVNPTMPMRSEFEDPGTYSNSDLLKGRSDVHSDTDNPLSLKIHNSDSVQPDQNWLSKEGFGARHQAKTLKLSFVPTLSNNGDQKTKIESSLDRHLRSPIASAEKNNHTRSEYTVEDKKSEDVDFLRASDIRASSGLASRTRREAESKKQEKRQNLPAEYGNDIAQAGDSSGKPVWVQPSFAGDHESEHLDRPFPKEQPTTGVGSKIPEVDGGDEKAPPVNLTSFAGEKWQDSTRALLEAEVEAQKIAMQAMNMRKTDDSKLQNSSSAPPLYPGEGDMAHNVHELVGQDRWYKQKAPHALTQTREEDIDMIDLGRGEGDMASNVHEFAGTDRWYKQKAPHAIQQASLKLRPSTQDRALIREVRDNYQLAFGKIGTKHRQPSQRKTQSQASITSPLRPSPPFPSLEPQNGLSKVSASQTPANEPLAIIQKLYQGLRDTQRLVHHTRLIFSTKDDVYRSCEAYAQSAMRTFKAALEIFEMKEFGALSNQHENGIAGNEAASLNSDSLNFVSFNESRNSRIPPPSAISIYKILAFDSSTQEVVTTGTTSSIATSDEVLLPPPEALSRLSSPAKFLPYLSALHVAGYEIVSGSTNLLVFKKVRETQDHMQNADELQFSRNTADVAKQPVNFMNPIDGTTIQTGNFASPTGFVNHDSVLPASFSELKKPPSSAASNISPNEKVKREEDVFSGSSRNRWQEKNNKPRGKLGMAAKRVFWVSVWMAGCCYAVGVVAEFFRTGGSSGLGAQGF